MDKSESIKNIASALKIFHIEAEPIQKDASNPYFKSNYATLSAILKAIKKPLIRSSLVLTQWPDGENELTTLLIHTESGEWLKATYKMIPAKNDPQGQGSAITYMRRYAIGAILGLDILEDDDANAATYGKKKKETYPTVSTPQVPQDLDSQKKKIVQLLLALNRIGSEYTKEEVEGAVKMTTNLSLIPNNFEEIIKRLSALNEA